MAKNKNPLIPARAAHAVGLTLTLSCCLLSWGCTQPAAVTEPEPSPTAEQILSYSGCGITKKAFMAELATAFEADSGITVNVAGGGATKGIVNAAGRSSDLGGGCRHKLNGPEEASATQHHVAWDALVVIVHPDNPVQSISSDQLRKVLTGQIVNWSELGLGWDSEILVGTRNGKISGVGRMVRELIFQDLSADYSASSLVFPSSGPLEQSVESTLQMIAVTGISSAKKRQVKVLPVDGVEPSYDNIASGEYPYFRPLFLYTHNEPEPHTLRFIDFARSAQGQEIIRAQGTVNLEDGKALAGRYNAQMESLGLEPELWALGT